MPTQPSNGARITRRSRASSASRSGELGLADRELRPRSCTSLTARESFSRSLRASVARASSSVRRARSSSISSASESSCTRPGPRHLVAGVHLDGCDPPGDVGRERHRSRRPAVADRRDLVVHLGLFDHGSAHHRPSADGPRRKIARLRRHLGRPDRKPHALEQRRCRRHVPHPDEGDGRQHQERDRRLLPDPHSSGPSRVAAPRPSVRKIQLRPRGDKRNASARRPIT